MSGPPRPRLALARLAALAALLACALLASGCARWMMSRHYREAVLPDAQVLRDVPYVDGPGADAAKHRLDLFLPPPGTPAGRPVLVFVHGGGWTSGDRGYRFAGADVYGNIGRFFAAHGVATAVISYRLQPAVGWREQVADVASALGWLRAHAAGYGGDPDALFLSGHSAGAQLVARVAVDEAALRAAGVPRASVCGIVPVSGAAFDLEDAKTYALGAPRRYYAERFGGTNGNGNQPDPDWQRAASTVPLIDGEAPDALVVYAERDWPPLRHQSELLAEALRAHGAEARTLEIQNVDHYTIVPTLSRDDRTTGPAMLAFVRGRSCGSAGSEAAGGSD